MDKVKVRCRVCGWEREVSFPFTPYDEAVMNHHVMGHEAGHEADLDVVRCSKEEIEVEILERWFSLKDDREE